MDGWIKNGERDRNEKSSDNLLCTGDLGYEETKKTNVACVDLAIVFFEFYLFVFQHTIL